MFIIIECVVAALIAIALGIMIDADTRDTRIRVQRSDDMRFM
jgi:hypothetical protein